MNTVKLNNGRTVVAKFSDGRLVAKTYANRTGAEKAAALIGGTVLKGFGRPWYVAPRVKECVVCRAPGVVEFFCPCDLHHGLCATHQQIERKDCAYAHLYKQPWTVGDRVLCNGHEGAIGRLETGIMDGMATVRLERGQVCVDLIELRRPEAK